MSKQITEIVIASTIEHDQKRGRMSHTRASVWLYTGKEKVRQIDLTNVVHSERDLWDNVERAVSDLIEEGYEFDSDNVQVIMMRSIDTLEYLDYYESIGKHI